MDITNRLKLIRALEHEGVRPTAYSVNGRQDLALCLEQVSNGWEVFFFERGGKSFVKGFPNEESACVFMFDALMKDKTSFI